MPTNRPRPWFRRDRGEWYVTIRGKQVPLGVVDPRARAAAFAAMDQFFRDQERAGQGGRTVAELVPEYLAAVEHRIAPSTLQKYRLELAWLVAQFGPAQIADLVPTAVEKAANETGWSDSHKSNVLYTAQGFVRWAGRNEFTLRRPAKESRGAESVIPPELYELILRETTGDFHQFIRLMWNTGARPSELLMLTVEAVDWHNTSATLKRHKTKHKGKVRVIHFSPAAFKVVEEQRAKHRDGWLFRGGRGERLTVRAVVGRFLRLSEKIGRTVTAYFFRHTYATRALSAGESDAVVAALLGQSSTAMLNKHYSHLTQQSQVLKGAAGRLDAA